MRPVSESISELIDDIENEGYELEMAIEHTAGKSSGSRQRVKALSDVRDRLETVMKFAESKGL